MSVDSNVTVAGQAAYELVLAPKDSRSLIGQVQIAVDGRNGVPLRLQVFARGASTPAFQVGYTSIQFVTPAPGDLTFSPPPGAKVTRENLAGAQPSGSPGARPDVAAIGSGWLTVLDLASAGLTTPGSSPPASGSIASGDSAAVLHTLLLSATPVSGAWGSGQLIKTRLVNVLIAGGSMYVGAVEPSVLEAAAAAAGPGQSNTAH